jgi:hypothetical protein
LATAVARRLKASAPGSPGALVVGAREAQGDRGRRFGLDGEVGEHVDHQRLLDEVRAERAAMRGVPGRVGHRCAHPAGGAEDAVQARVVDHLDDRRHAAAGRADHPRQRAAELDLAGGVGAVAELLLEALQLEARVARAVGQHARQREARHAFVGPREDEEQVAHRRAAEPQDHDGPPADVAPARPPARLRNSHTPSRRSIFGRRERVKVSGLAERPGLNG